MALTTTGKPSNQLTFTLTETYSTAYASTLTGRGSSTSTRTVVGGNIITFENGTGTGQCNFGAQATGVLASGGKTVFDLTAFITNVFDNSININFSGVNAITVANTWQGPNNSGFVNASDMGTLVIATTGSNGWTNLFNGGTGNISLDPYGTLSSVSFTGYPVSSSNKELTLIDQGSGVAFEVTVIGNTGAPD